MDWLYALITNKYLITGLSSWFVAQFLKTIIYWVVNKKFDILRLFGDGGMPSGHSATVSSVATVCALIHGFSSFEFAISAIFAIIVCHDASGVRQETGKQSVVLNQLTELIEKISDHKLSDDVKLKEFVGHTFTQVIVGILLGIINAVVMYNLVF